MKFENKSWSINIIYVKWSIWFLILFFGSVWSFRKFILILYLFKLIQNDASIHPKLTLIMKQRYLHLKIVTKCKFYSIFPLLFFSLLLALLSLGLKPQNLLILLNNVDALNISNFSLSAHKHNKFLCSVVDNRTG